MSVYAGMNQMQRPPMMGQRPQGQPGLPQGIPGMAGGMPGGGRPPWMQGPPGGGGGGGNDQYARMNGMGGPPGMQRPGMPMGGTPGMGGGQQMGPHPGMPMGPGGVTPGMDPRMLAMLHQGQGGQMQQQYPPGTFPGAGGPPNEAQLRQQLGSSFDPRAFAAAQPGAVPRPQMGAPSAGPQPSQFATPNANPGAVTPPGINPYAAR